VGFFECVDECLQGPDQDKLPALFLVYWDKCQIGFVLRRRCVSNPAQRQGLAAEIGCQPPVGTGTRSTPMAFQSRRRWAGHWPVGTDLVAKAPPDGDTMLLRKAGIELEQVLAALWLIRFHPPSSTGDKP
jgi:hypothetical protein